MTKGKLLAVDDNKSILSALELLLQDDFEEIKTISNPNQLPSLIENGEFDLVLLDMNFSAGVNTGNEGLYWLSRIQELRPDMEVVLFTAYGDVELAVKALKKGAADFVLKPWDNEKLRATLNNVYKLQQSKKEIKQLKQKTQALRSEMDRNQHFIIARSPQMLDILNLVRKVAQTDANVLITGDNGTGKELIARELHRHSKRSNEIMVSVDMGAISETLFESELFGHKKGAFTDAREDRTGKIENANNGTLFLDEIGNLPIQLQPKLLAVLQNRVVTPIGTNKPVPVDIRLICATNRNPATMVAEGTFREDLLYRINTIHIEVPPLRERKEDIEAIAIHFLEVYRNKYRKPVKKISAAGLAKLTHYKWPGNVRELQHAIEKAVILSDDKAELTPDDFFFQPVIHDGDDVFEGTLEEMERKMIAKAIKSNNSNLSAVAGQLGVTRQTLYNKMKKYNL
ncbi:DNA-binding transcriptional response regulator, NtrC family, contains REC, AAA-type ATPase, and a Fis-type DNA-binding domains [Mariniphaga anaerophila]|uniref:DNA-binding transcriptional response regulator, NtrC family, contains REC, AAA-type ATPase, and a Fis-type DNA-binding domains n=1 Tax=Mariniphaga anaerophila TaxID=1484053 RepID=A0A1M5FQ71_9BACT|nr:sigma-54 dependent transcriptional regulator [Mariniphaga anaerophila]SHF93554.1 DNA-binding transcriptional response regulator, NtrC family, contains REC, AAA-type ATPase, and a Fis-type DNA-binding domains [Mariniphaga anaerophila]